jgi:hypothetical protein
MLEVLPLLVSDPSLPDDVRRALARTPEDGARALIQLGLPCRDAAWLVGLEADRCASSPVPPR